MVGMMGLFFAWAHLRPLWKGRKPVKEKLLRSPGESLQIKIEELTESFVLPLIILLVLGMALGGFTSAVVKHGGAMKVELLIGGWAIALIGMVLSGVRLLCVSRLLAEGSLPSKQRHTGRNRTETMTSTR